MPVTTLPPRLESLRQLLTQNELDAMLVTDDINVRYVTGFTGDSSYLLVTQESASILSDGRYSIQLSNECPAFEHAIRLPSVSMADLMAEQVNRLGTMRVGFEASHVSCASFQVMQEKCPAVNWASTSGLVESLRMVKDAAEIERICRAIEIAERSYQSILPRLSGDWTEIEVAHTLEATMRELGAEGVSFAPIIGAGCSGALPHYRPRRETLAGTPYLLMDFGAKFEGYASDITRTLHVGKPSDSFRRAYDAVLESQLAAIAAIGPGVSAKEVDATAREVLKRHGLGDAFKHGLGHGIGLQIHESPRMSSLSTEDLATGMVITVEPGVYFEGEFGIRIEDDVLVTENGRQVLTQLGKGLDECQLIL